MNTAALVREPPSELLELLESELRSARLGTEGSGGHALQAQHFERALAGPLRDFFSRPGKEFRGGLVASAYAIAGGKGSAPALLSCIVEILHAGSLIIDDIEDGSAYRRGASTLHVRYGLPVALNAGNWLYFWAESLIERLGVSPSQELAMHRVVSRSLADCHRGQGLDLTLRMSQLAQVEVPAAVATTTALKTGALMELAASLGAIAAGAPYERVAALVTFGSELGTALQMLDDVGGLFAPRLAHKGHEDLRLARPTWPWAWLAESLPEIRYAQLRAEALDVERGDRHPERLAERLRAELGADPKGRVRERSSRAVARLRAQFGSSPALAALCAEIGRLERSYD